MTKPVLFRLTKTMVKLIKVYYINTLEIGGGGGAYLHFLYQCKIRFIPLRLRVT